MSRNSYHVTYPSCYPSAHSCLKHMLLLDNFVHSDLHPSNIMIKFIKPKSTKLVPQNLFTSIFRPHSTSESLPKDHSDSDSILNQTHMPTNSPLSWHAKLVSLSQRGYIPETIFIDAGLVTTLNATNRQNLLDLLCAVFQFDGYRTGQLMVECCHTPELAIETETFSLKMQNVVLSIKHKTFSLGQIKLSDILINILKAVCIHHVKMVGDFINTVISILLLEGIGR